MLLVLGNISDRHSPHTKVGMSSSNSTPMTFEMLMMGLDILASRSRAERQLRAGNEAPDFAPGEIGSAEWDAWAEEALKSEEGQALKREEAQMERDQGSDREHDEDWLNRRVLECMAAFCECCMQHYVPYKGHVNWYEDPIQGSVCANASSACTLCESQLDSVPEISFTA